CCELSRPDPHNVGKRAEALQFFPRLAFEITLGRRGTQPTDRTQSVIAERVSKPAACELRLGHRHTKNRSEELPVWRRFSQAALNSLHDRSEFRRGLLAVVDHPPQHYVVRPRLCRLRRRNRSLLVVGSTPRRPDPRDQQLQLVPVFRTDFVGLEPAADHPMCAHCCAVSRETKNFAVTLERFPAPAGPK